MVFRSFLFRIERKDRKFFHVVPIFTDLGQDLIYLVHKENTQRLSCGAGEKIELPFLLLRLCCIIPSSMVKIWTLWSCWKITDGGGHPWPYKSKLIIEQLRTDELPLKYRFIAVKESYVHLWCPRTRSSAACTSSWRAPRRKSSPVGSPFSVHSGKRNFQIQSP